MVIKVGINGFGRIGRIMFRTCFQNSDIEVTAINDPAIDVEYICYLIKFDSVHGNFNGDVTTLNGDIKINGNMIKIFRAKEPSKVPWNLASVQYVIESSGMFTNFEKAAGHLSVEGVRRVLITAPSSDVPMIIHGVNDDKMHQDQKVISCASSTLYALAPLMKVLENNFGISEGFVTSIHAMTPSLKPLDGLCLRGKHWRDYRSIHQNIIPAMTGACKALGKIMPQLKDKMIGLAFRVPIVNVSVLDITVRLNRDTTIQNIVKCVKIASTTCLKGVVDVSNEEAVSSDFIRDSHSCILDVNSSLQLRPNFYKLVCWYENEFSYACRVIDSIIYSERQFTQARIVKDRKVDTGLLEDNQLTIDKSLGSCHNSKPLSNLLRSFSKNLDLKIKSYCSQISRTAPLRTQISVVNQGIIADRDSITRSEVIKIFNVDSSFDTTNLNDDDKINLQICSNLPILEANNTSNTQSCMDDIKNEFNKMINITEELIKKSNELYLNDISENLVEKKVCKEECVTKTNSNVFINSSGNTNNSADCQSCNSCNCTRYLTDTNRKLANGVIDESPVEVCSREAHNYDKTTPEKGTHNFEYESVDKFQVKTLYDTDTDEGPPKFDIGVLTPKEATTNLQQEERYLSTNDWQINSYKIKECFLKNKQKIEDEMFKKHPDVLKLGNVIISKGDIDNVNPVSSSRAENKSGYVFSGKTDDGKDKSNKISGQRVKQNVSVKKQMICEHLALHHTQDNFKGTKEDANKNESDIYDKLNSTSTSATNSENSFNVNKKQSQVISINDLTNSLDDLARLEKICKIIEISDELSDQLFSTLQVKDEPGLSNRKWSFKDLCEKIKLDDFCDKVFRE